MHIEKWLSAFGRDAAVATLNAASVPAAPLVNALHHAEPTRISAILPYHDAR
jgi:hypothetical protein